MRPMSCGLRSRGIKGPNTALRGPAMRASAASRCDGDMASRGISGMRSAVVGKKPWGMLAGCGVGAVLMARVLWVGWREQAQGYQRPCCLVSRPKKRPPFGGLLKVLLEGRTSLGDQLI